MQSSCSVSNMCVLLLLVLLVLGSLTVERMGGWTRSGTVDHSPTNRPMMMTMAVEHEKSVKRGIYHKYFDCPRIYNITFYRIHLPEFGHAASTWEEIHVQLCVFGEIVVHSHWQYGVLVIFTDVWTLYWVG